MNLKHSKAIKGLRLKYSLEDSYEKLNKLISTYPQIFNNNTVNSIITIFAGFAGRNIELKIFKAQLETYVDVNIDCLNVLLDKNILEIGIILHAKFYTTEDLLKNALLETKLNKYFSALIFYEALAYLDITKLNNSENSIKSIATYFYMQNQFDEMFVAYDILNMIEPKGRYSRYLKMAKNRVSEKNNSFAYRKFTSSNIHKEGSYKNSNNNNIERSIGSSSEVTKNRNSAIEMLENKLAKAPRNYNTRIRIAKLYKKAFLDSKNKSNKEAEKMLLLAEYHCNIAMQLSPDAQARLEYQSITRLMEK